MQTIRTSVDRDEVRIYVPETRDDLETMEAWVASRSREHLGIDTETTGTEQYRDDFKVRTVQLSNADEAFVVPLDERAWVSEAHGTIRRVLQRHRKWVMHNAPFDLIALTRAGLLDHPADMQPNVIDTYLLAHLLDPRAAGEDSATGHSLKGLSAQWIDLFAADEQKDLIALFRTKYKRTKDTGWSAEGLTHDETYLTYAGLDPILTRRLMDVLGPRLRARGLYDLFQWEREIQACTLGMEYRGVLLDVDYTKRLVNDLNDEGDRYRAIAAQWGVENVNSTAQVVSALTASGVKLTARTATGNLSVGKDALLPLAGLTPYWEPIEGVTPHPLADAVVRAKRADKWRVAYAQAFLDLRDENDRVHPGIKSLAARTGRMSVVAPPLQQLPAGDWRIRRAFIPDPGNVFISSDYEQIELRVIAANAGVTQMIDAINTGVDLHNRTADLIWPLGWTKKQRGIAKNVAFGYAYGAGPKKISETAGISVGEARNVVKAFERGYPEIPQFSDRLQEEAAESNWFITTAFGRPLPVSPNRGYAALNYATQSTARDLFAEGMLKVWRSPGMHDRLSLVIHDEVLHQAPVEEAEAQAKQVQAAMERVFRGVPIAADSEIAPGGSWGSLYSVPEGMDREIGE